MLTVRRGLQSGKAKMQAQMMVAECDRAPGVRVAMYGPVDPATAWALWFEPIAPEATFSGNTVTFPNGSTITIGMPKKKVE